MSMVFTKLRHLDAYSKPLEDFRIRTLTGGAVTLISGTIMLILFLSELSHYMKTEIEETLFVDTSSGDEKVKIVFDVVFPALPCPFVSVDAMDVSGEHQSDVSHNVWKKRLDKDSQPIHGDPHKIEIGTGKPKMEAAVNSTCGSCYGAESALRKCCETCDDVKRAYSEKGWALHDFDRIVQCKGESWVKTWQDHKDEGCQVYGNIEVAKFNTSHVIMHFSFGEPYPGKSYPLNGHASVDQTGGTMFQYYVKIVPTAYEYIEDTNVINTHQFSVTKHQKNVHAGIGDGLPGLFVLYEFSPLMVKLTEMKQSFTHFLTSVCAIVGGIFTVASLIDSFLYHSSRVLQQKIDLGKAS